MACRALLEKGYESVADAFARNFDDYGEISAAFAAYRDGVRVVDIWGGTDLVASLTWANPTLFNARLWPWNLRSYHAAEMPGVGGIGDARSMARLYGARARGGEIDGVRILSNESVALARRVRALEPVTGRQMAYGVEFALPTELVPYGAPGDAFGHRGAGGRCTAPGRASGWAFLIAPNLMVDRWPSDIRADALLIALYQLVR